MAVTRLDQNQVDYKMHRASFEVLYRVELLKERLAILGSRREAAVVEIGLGSGLTTQMLVSRFDRVTCIDIEQSRLDEVAAFIAPATADLVCASGESVKLAPESVDHVFLIGLLEHCPDAIAVLENVRPCLKKNGRVHILVNNAGSIHRHLGVQLGMIDELQTLSESDVRLGHHRVYTANALYAEISKAGLHVDYIDHHYMKPLPSSLMDELPLELNQAFLHLGRKFTQFAAYIYLEVKL